MAQDEPADKAVGKKNQLIEKLHEQFDPGEKFPVDPKDSGPKRSQKQPGQELQDPQEDGTMADEPEHARERPADPGERQNAQGDHAGTAHDPEEFDALNPQKLGPQGRRAVPRPDSE